MDHHSSSSDALRDKDAERMLVACLLLGPDCLPAITVEAKHFSSPLYCRCFGALCHRIRGGEAPDIGTMIQDLDLHGDEYAQAAELIGIIPVKGSAPGYERRMVRAHARRQAARLAEQLNDTLADRMSTAADVAELAEGVAAKMAEDKAGGVKTAGELMDQYCGWLKDRGARHVMTGWRLFDTHASLRPGELMVLTARTGVGKSALAQAVTMQSAERHPDAFVLYLSLEMPEESCWERMAQIRYGWTRQEAEDYHRNGNDGGMIGELIGHLKNVLFGFAAPVTLGDIKRTVQHVRSRHRVLLVVVDHVDYVRLAAGKDSKAEKLRDLYAGLKTMAKSESVAVLALAQTEREKGGDGDKPLTLDAVRSSAGAEESADFLLGAWRPEKRQELQTEPLMVKVLKGRRCEGVAQEFQFEGRYLRITQLEEWS